MADYGWKPIEPLSEREKTIDLAAMRPLYETWRASKQRLQESSPASLREFNERLIRRLSIETGILERLYDLDRGTTEALVAQGFLEDLVARSSTDIDPAHLVDILRDQEAAIHLVMDCAGGNRELSVGVLHELHAILTEHQDFTTAVDQSGGRHQIKLLKGKFKELPNNPLRPDGTIHEYCPPVHVQTEVERLLAWLKSYSHEDPLIVATWLHHRFTQIHPYQDGNGRVARAITTLVLLRAELLPLVIDRDLRSDYITSLEVADCGDLSALAALFARLERTAIMQALSIDTDKEVAYQQSLTSAVIQSLAQKFKRRREAKNAELRAVNSVAQSLRSLTRTALETTFEDLTAPLSTIARPQVSINEGGPDYDNAYWYKFEVVQSATQSGKYANFDEAHYFVKSAVRVGRERLVFVVSFHHVGRELSGVMEATGFVRVESYEDSDDREIAGEEFFVCSVEPFVFTYKTTAEQITDAFSRWLDATTAVALKEFGDKL